MTIEALKILKQYLAVQYLLGLEFPPLYQTRISPATSHFSPISLVNNNMSTFLGYCLALLHFPREH